MVKNRLKIGYKLVIGSMVFISGIPVAKGDLLREGREAFMTYDFELASEKYEKYAKTMRKGQNAPDEELLETYMRQLEIAENSLDNVQKIEIIDRIDVPVSDFVKHIKLPASGGKLLSPDASILRKRHNQSDFAYSSESGDVMMWSENDDDHMEVIMQSEQLMDGSWELPVNVGTILNEGGNARNPFLLTDGVTLYFSGDGEGSMGGYDLFVATKDPATGEFRQPIGLGYPFNSPYNEYMIAIDEEYGIGWWVTDRNRLEDQVTIYVFKTNEVRKNYNPDEEDDIISLARIDDISVTQDPGTDYSAIIRDINKRSSQGKKDSDESSFIFPMQGGKVMRRISDFKSNSARSNMQQYLQALDEHKALENKLTDLRKRYHQTDKKKGSATALKNQILELEKQRDWQNERLLKMRNTIITAETKD
ncbi:MAG: hypothetical protein K2L22_11200 [Muribaculaceae bacterium]|nr:hypothetical protein [Muribaculaceae bacterium]